MKDNSFKRFFHESSERIFAESNESSEILQHITHLEELILTNKKDGLDIAIRFLKELHSKIKGHVDSPTFVSVKFDGSPSLICGYHPELKKFFVSTKSVANVNPKINFSDEDIEKNHGHSPGLVKKLKIALRYLPAVINKGAIYQGDFLFDKDDLTSQEIDGENLITFKPNTITYAVEANSNLGQKLLTSEMGIIFHTKYVGPTLTSLTKSSDVNVSEFNLSKRVFVDDAKFKDVSGMATFTKQESAVLERSVKDSQKIGNKVKWDLVSDKTYELLNTFVNSLIRSGRFIEDPIEDYDIFINWLTQKSEASIDKMKTEKGKTKKKESFDLFLKQLESNKLSILNLFVLSKTLEKAKQIIISKYNSAIRTKQFITQPDGTLKVTAPEGYVAVDHLGNIVKFVSRLDFSAANFSVSRN